MVKRFVLTLLIAISHLSLISAQQETVVKEADPATQLVKADSLLKKAIATHNVPLLAEALQKQTRYQLDIATDSLPSLIYRVEHLKQRSSGAVERSVLSAILSTMYHTYLEYSGDYTTRVSLADTLPADIREWSPGMIIKKIASLAQESILPKKELQEVPASDYKNVFDIKEIQNYPTLFDLLCRQAITTYMNIPYWQTGQITAQQTLTSLNIISPIQTFLSLNIPTEPLQLEKSILVLYQQLLNSIDTRKNQSALVYSDLDRLNYAYPFVVDPNREKYILQTLWGLLENNRNNPVSTEIVKNIWFGYLSAEQRDKQNYAALNRLLHECETLHRVYNDSVTDLIKKQLVAPFYHIGVKNIIYPGNKEKISVSYRNVKQFRVIISSVGCTPPELQQYLQSKKNIPLKEIWSKDMTLSDTLSLIDNDTTILLPELKNGFYSLQVIPDSVSRNSYTGYFSVSELMTVSKSGLGHNADIIVVNAKTGKPCADVSVTLLNHIYQNGEIRYETIKTIKTNSLGMATVSDKNAAFYYIHTKDDPAQPVTRLAYRYYNDDGRPENGNRTTALFTDRSVYRPGQTVYFSGIDYTLGPDIRKVNPAATVTVSLRDSRNNPVAEQKFVTDSLGSFSGSFVLPKDKLTGYFYLQTANGSAFIQVAEYKRPTFNIKFNPVTESFTFKALAQVTGQATAYSGAAIPDARVKYTVTRTPFWLRMWPTPAEQVAAGEVLTNDKGEFTIRFAPRKTDKDAAQPEVFYTYRIDASVTSASGETQTGQTMVSVGDVLLSIRIAAPWKIDKDKPAGIDIDVTNLNGQPMKQKCQYILYSLYDNKEMTDIKPLDSLKIRMQVFETFFESGEKPAQPQWEKLPSGAYRLMVQTKDANGRVVSNTASFVLYGDKDKRPPVLAEEWLPETEYTCAPGENVNIVFGSSFSNAYMLCELYDGNKQIAIKRLVLNNRNFYYPVKYLPGYGDALTMEISFIKEFKLYHQTVTIFKKQPDVKLNIETSTFRDKLLPGQEEEWKFTVRDADGKPVTARFMAEMFDASLNTFRQHQWRFNPIYYVYPRTFSWYNNYDTGTNIRPAIFIRGTGPALQETAVVAYSSKSVADTQNLMKSDAGNNNAPDMEMRSDFNETAFFYPQLTTNSNGEVSFTFKTPGSNTEWQFMALAYTRNLLFGQLDKKVVSSKKLMVTPNIPRFVRQGDQVVISSQVANQSDETIEGDVIFELFDPYTDEVITKSSVPAILFSGQNKTMQFNLKAPLDLDLIGVRIKAVSAKYTDGEQHLLPVLPSRALVTDALPFTMNGAGKKSFTLKNLKTNKSETLDNYRLTLEYTSNPAWFVVQALPSLTETETTNVLKLLANFYGNTIASGIARTNPKIGEAIRIWKAEGKTDKETLVSNLQKNESLKSILLSETPWVLDATNITERMQKLSNLFDQNTIAYNQQRALQQLRELQLPEGGWSWFKGFGSSPLITMHVLEGMARLTGIGMIEYDNNAKQMQIKALNYIDTCFVKGIGDKEPQLSHLNLLYLYTRSSYRDIPITGETLGYHKALMKKLQLLWPNLTLADKALAAITLHRYGFTDDAKKVIQSLTGFSTRTEEMGMFWQNNTASTGNPEGAIRVHTLIMTAYGEIEPDSPLLTDMKQWLLMQKQTQDWGSTPATADAIYVMLSFGNDWLTTSNQDTHIEWGGQEIKALSKDPLSGYIQTTRQGDGINSSAATVTIDTENTHPSWGALYWQYFEDFGRIHKTGYGLTIDKTLYREEFTTTGKQLVPVSKTSVKPGDKLTVRLVLKSDRDLEFVHLKDQRAACFEPTEQLSGYFYQDKTMYYQENRDAFTNFYFDFLPKGSYVLSYDVWVDRQGTYNNGITSVQCLYAPQYSAFTQGGILIIK